MRPTVRKPSIPASQKAMDLLAMRDHSVLELKKKLKQKGYEQPEIEKAIDYVEKNGWIKEPKALAESVSKSLSRRGKSQRQINMKLAAIGLPTIKADPNEELEKALRLVEGKLTVPEDLDFEEKQQLKAKWARRLQGRGFSSEIIGKVLHEKFRN